MTGSSMPMWMDTDHFVWTVRLNLPAPMRRAGGESVNNIALGVL